MQYRHARCSAATRWKSVAGEEREAAVQVNNDEGSTVRSRQSDCIDRGQGRESPLVVRSLGDAHEISYSQSLQVMNEKMPDYDSPS